MAGIIERFTAAPSHLPRAVVGGALSIKAESTATDNPVRRVRLNEMTDDAVRQLNAYARQLLSALDDLRESGATVEELAAAAEEVLRLYKARADELGVPV
jgi:hypothetical protein